MLYHSYSNVCIFFSVEQLGFTPFGITDGSFAKEAFEKYGEENLPKGWKKTKHPASGQFYYLNEITKVKRWTRPEEENDISDIANRKTNDKNDNDHNNDTTTTKRTDKNQKCLNVNNKSNIIHNNDHGRNHDKSKKRKERDIDPLDPTNGRGEKKGGANTTGDIMADSTATGSLFQQRPYPAPGSILRVKPS